MKISKLLETNTTPSSDPAGQQSQQAPKFGRDPHVLEDEKLEEMTAGATGSGSVATGGPTNMGVQRRGKGSMFQGIKTSKKFPNSAAVKEGAEQRQQNALWAQITDYEKRAKATKNDIKKAHYMKMASELRNKLKTNDEQGLAEAYPAHIQKGKELDAATKKIQANLDRRIRGHELDAATKEIQKNLDKRIKKVDQGVAEGTSPFGNKVAGPFASEERAKREASRISKELGVKRYVEKTSDGKYIVVKKQGMAEGSEEQVYKVVALDKSNALKKPTKLNVKASNIEDVFSRLAANDWYALSINGVEVVGGKRLKQGVAEGPDKLQGTPVVSLSDFTDRDTKKNKYGQTVPKKLKKDDPRVKFHKDEKKGVVEGTNDDFEQAHHNEVERYITAHGTPGEYSHKYDNMGRAHNSHLTYPGRTVTINTQKYGDKFGHNVFTKKDKEVDEGYDKWGWHTSVTNGEFMPTKYGNKNYVYLHDMDNQSANGNPQLVTFNKPAHAKKAAAQFGGKVVKTDLNTYRVVKPAEQGVTEGSEELYGLRVGDTVATEINGQVVQGDIIDIFPQEMKVELLLRGPDSGKTVVVDVRDTESLNEQEKYPEPEQEIIDATRRARLQREREPHGSEKIDAMLAQRNAQLRQYDETGKFWLKTKAQPQTHLEGPFIGKQAANQAALDLIKRAPELKDNLLITAYGPDENQTNEALDPKSVEALKQAKQKIAQNREQDVSSWKQDFEKNMAARYRTAQQPSVNPDVAQFMPATPTVSAPGETHKQLIDRRAMLDSAIEKQTLLNKLRKKAENNGLLTAGLDADTDTSLYIKDAYKDNYQTLNSKLDKALDVIQRRLGTNKLAFAKPSAIKEDNQFDVGNVLDLSKNWGNFNKLHGKIISVNPSGKLKIQIVAADPAAGKKVKLAKGDVVTVSPNFLKRVSVIDPNVMEAELSEEQLLAKELRKQLELFKQGVDHDLGSRPKDHDLGDRPKDKEIQTKEGSKNEMKINEFMSESKPGLWANIHAKRERIKHGSGERMRKPGSKGAPSAQDFKDAAKTTKTDEAANPAQQAAIAIAMKKKGQKPKNEEFNPEYDDEAGMADNNLETLKRAVEGIDQIIQPGDNLPEWCQEKIAVAKSMLVTVWDYMKSEEETKMAEAQFDMIESMVESWAQKHGVDVDVIWEDLTEVADEELVSLCEDWQKVNKKDKTPGMSRKAVKAYRRENPGSKLQTAVTTKPSKLKKGSKAAKRRKSFCARMSGMKKAHASAKTKRDPDSPINKALRRWNC